jgi:L-cysteine:1D-myo-inositol 2-amino-2-deoxy-alpha-D-glucopyranoside ligase
MISWPQIHQPDIEVKLKPLILNDSKQGMVQVRNSRFFSMYVCGITPYDATHLGHAATYIAFDLINRYLKLEHTSVHFVENITDIDDPLFERASRDSIDWKTLAQSQISLFTEDMCALKILPPDDFVRVTDSINLVIEFIKMLQRKGYVYEISGDFYFASSVFLSDLPIPQAEAVEIFAQRGGDPTREGKAHPLDPILWLKNKDQEPGWESPFGFGRPGWHVECTAIALDYLDRNEEDYVIDLQGGGNDLLFPHHFMSAQLIKAATGRDFAKFYIHTGLVGYEGEKMSKSKGNLEFVSRLIKQGVDPVVIRWALIRNHYQSYREWNVGLLQNSVSEVDLIRKALAKSEVSPVDELIEEIISALSNNLQTQVVTDLIIAWARNSLAGDDSTSFKNDSGKLSRVLDSLLGLVF